MSLPNYLRKPKHKRPVVATKNGWEVAETGELLVRVKDLDKKLAEYLGIESVVFGVKNSVKEVVEQVEVVAEDDTDLEELLKTAEDAKVAEDSAVVAQEEVKDAQPEPEKKRRGRRPKVDNKV